MSDKNSRLFVIIGGTITIVGAVAQLFDFGAAPFIFSAGALVMIVLQLIQALNDKSDDLRQKRLSRLAFMVSLFLGLAAYLMFTHSNLWVVAILVYAFTTLFLSFRTR
ncbi:MAG: hypothetical protein LLF95_08245 [Bacteroidales bacterium]|nr:hypothetical protein [Bacteroidales bacterium]